RDVAVGGPSTRKDHSVRRLRWPAPTMVVLRPLFGNLWELQRQAIQQTGSAARKLLHSREGTGQERNTDRSTTLAERTLGLGLPGTALQADGRQQSERESLHQQRSAMLGSYQITEAVAVAPRDSFVSPKERKRKRQRSRRTARKYAWSDQEADSHRRVVRSSS